MKDALALEILKKLNSLPHGGADALFVSYVQDHSGMAEVLPIMGRFTPGHCTLILSVVIEHMLENYEDTCECDGCDWALKTMQDLHELLQERRRQLKNPQFN